jgi:hypothetical protein
VSGSLDEEGVWGAKLVGVLYLLLGVLTVARPALSALRPGTVLMFGFLGVPAMVSRGPESWVALIVVGGVLLAVGAFIILRRSWAHWGGMLVALVLFVPAVPYITLAGLLIIWVLWRGRPRRQQV